MSDKNEFNQNVFEIKSKELNEKDHIVGEQDLYPQSTEDMTCWEKFKNAINNFINRTIDYFEYDRVFNSEGQPHIDIKKCYKRFLQNYDQTYSERQIRFAFSFDYVLQEKIKEEERKEKNLYRQLYRFICCEGGNQMIQVDEAYKSEREYQRIIKKKLLDKKEEFEEMMRKQDEQLKEKEKQNNKQNEFDQQKEMKKEKDNEKLQEIINNDTLQFYDEDDYDQKEVSKRKKNQELVNLNTKILKVNQTEQNILSSENVDEASERTHKKGQTDKNKQLNQIIYLNEQDFNDSIEHTMSNKYAKSFNSTNINQVNRRNISNTIIEENIISKNTHQDNYNENNFYFDDDGEKNLNKKKKIEGEFNEIQDFSHKRRKIKRNGEEEINIANTTKASRATDQGLNLKNQNDNKVSKNLNNTSLNQGNSLGMSSGTDTSAPTNFGYSQGYFQNQKHNQTHGGAKQQKFANNNKSLNRNDPNIINNHDEYNRDALKVNKGDNKDALKVNKISNIEQSNNRNKNLLGESNELVNLNRNKSYSPSKNVDADIDIDDWDNFGNNEPTTKNKKNDSKNMNFEGNEIDWAKSTNKNNEGYNANPNNSKSYKNKSSVYENELNSKKNQYQKDPNSTNNKTNTYDQKNTSNANVKANNIDSKGMKIVDPSAIYKPTGISNSEYDASDTNYVAQQKPQKNNYQQNSSDSFDFDLKNKGSLQILSLKHHNKGKSPSKVEEENEDILKVEKMRNKGSNEPSNNKFIPHSIDDDNLLFDLQDDADTYNKNNKNKNSKNNNSNNNGSSNNYSIGNNNNNNNDSSNKNSNQSPNNNNNINNQLNPQQNNKTKKRRKGPSQEQEDDFQINNNREDKSFRNKDGQINSPQKSDLQHNGEALKSKKARKVKQTKDNQEDTIQIGFEDEDNKASHENGEIQNQQQAHKKRKVKKLVQNEENVQEEINLEDFRVDDSALHDSMPISNTVGFPSAQEGESILQASKKRRNKKQLRNKQDELNIEEVVFDSLEEVDLSQSKDDQSNVDQSTFVKAQKKRKRVKQRKEDENHEEQIIQINF